MWGRIPILLSVRAGLESCTTAATTCPNLRHYLEFPNAETVFFLHPSDKRDTIGTLVRGKRSSFAESIREQSQLRMSPA